MNYEYIQYNYNYMIIIHIHEYIFIYQQYDELKNTVVLRQAEPYVSPRYFSTFSLVRLKEHSQI